MITRPRKVLKSSFDQSFLTRVLFRIFFMNISKTSEASVVEYVVSVEKKMVAVSTKRKPTSNQKAVIANYSKESKFLLINSHFTQGNLSITATCKDHDATFAKALSN